MEVFSTTRLRLELFTATDQAFILELLNEADFLRYIGDKGVRTLAEAERYLLEGPLASYTQHGYGLWKVVAKESGETVGMCGLIRRDYLDAPDIGFAFLNRHRAHGYGYEAGVETIAYGRQALGMARILAITQPDNLASITLLRKLGLREEGTHVAPTDGKTLLVFSTSPRAVKA